MGILNFLGKHFFALGAAMALSACGSIDARDSADVIAARAAAARTLAEVATRVAVAKTGAQVCRQMTVGISERDWIRGIVVGADKDRVRVRVEEPGRFAHTLHGVEISRGTEVWDQLLEWIPCS